MSYIDIQKKLEEDIRLRYAMFDRPLSGKVNPIVDSYMPKYMIDSMNINTENINTEKLPKTSFAISEFFAKENGVRQLPFKYMLQILNITDKELRRMVLDTKRQELDFVFVGCGGQGSNTYYWLTKICEHLNIVNLFKNVYAYDEDLVDLSNILRFPFHINDVKFNNFQMYKSQIIDRNSILSKNVFQNVSKINPVKYYNDHYKYYEHITEEFNEYTLVTNDRYSVLKYCKEKRVDNIITYHYKPEKQEKTIFYGAPDLQTREDFNEARLNLINATHGNDDCSLILNPTINGDIQVEGYGVIRLTSFFFNQLAMTIALLRFLADPNEDKWNQSGEIFNFNFKDFMDSEERGHADIVLNFQLEHNGLLDMGGNNV